MGPPGTQTPLQISSFLAFVAAPVAAPGEHSSEYLAVVEFTADEAGDLCPGAALVVEQADPPVAQIVRAENSGSASPSLLNSATLCPCARN